MKSYILFLIGLYKHTLSNNWHIFGFLNFSCKFYPSCSEYGYRAIERFGIARGLRMSIARICRCHPLSRGGYDDVPQK